MTKNAFIAALNDNNTEFYKTTRFIVGFVNEVGKKYRDLHIIQMDCLFLRNDWLTVFYFMIPYIDKI